LAVPYDSARVEEPRAVVLNGAHETIADDLNKFLSTPSFDTKQVAIESLIKEMTQHKKLASNDANSAKVKQHK
jgi:hypothetical protein